MEKSIYCFGRFLAILGGGIAFANSFEKETKDFPTWQKQSKDPTANYYEYEKRIKDFNMYIAPQNRKDSQTLILGGFTTILLSSSMSAFYAIERNTRKKEE